MYISINVCMCLCILFAIDNITIPLILLYQKAEKLG